MALKAKKYCIRCGHEMWYDESKKRWCCTNPKCVKYVPPVPYVPDKTEDNGEEDSEDSAE